MISPSKVTTDRVESPTEFCKRCTHGRKSHIEDDNSCYVEGCFCPEFTREG